MIFDAIFGEAMLKRSNDSKVISDVDPDVNLKV